MKLVLLAEAQLRFEAEDEWWRENRDATELFIDELTETLGLLTSTPEVGQSYRVARGKLIQRVPRSASSQAGASAAIACVSGIRRSRRA